MTISIPDINGNPVTVKTIDDGVQLAAPADTTTRIGRISNDIFYGDSSAVLASSAVYAGAARDCGFGTSTPQSLSYFTGAALADVAGTLRVQGSDDATAWVDLQSIAVPANVLTAIKVPVMFRYHRNIYTNGTTAQTTFRLRSKYSLA